MTKKHAIKAYADELRVMHELKTFVNRDVEKALGIPYSAAAAILKTLRDNGLVESIKVYGWTLNTLTDAGRLAVQRMQPVNPDERTLPLDWINEDE